MQCTITRSHGNFQSVVTSSYVFVRGLSEMVKRAVFLQRTSNGNKTSQCKIKELKLVLFYTKFSYTSILRMQHIHMTIPRILYPNCLDHTRWGKTPSLLSVGHCEGRGGHRKVGLGSKGAGSREVPVTTLPSRKDGVAQRAARICR